MKSQASQTYKAEWQRLALYLEAHWPTIRQGNTVDTVVWLLEYLRTIEMSGVLPSYDQDNTLVRTVQGAAALAGLLRDGSDGAA